MAKEHLKNCSREIRHYPLLIEVLIRTVALENDLALPNKLKYGHTLQPNSVYISDIYTRETLAQVHQRPFSGMFIAVLANVHQLQCIYIMSD